MGTGQWVELARRIRETVSMEEVAQCYGFAPNRAGFIRCPFHKGDNTPSLKLYPDGRGWCCFGCHKGGDAIRFVRELYGLDFRQAVLRLDNDLKLGMVGAAPSPKESALLTQRRQEEAERKERHLQYIDHWERTIQLTKEIDALSDQVLELLQERAEADRWLEEHENWYRKG